MLYSTIHEFIRKINNLVDDPDYPSFCRLSDQIEFVILNALGNKEEVINIDIFARTTKNYYSIIRDLLENSFQKNNIDRLDQKRKNNIDGITNRWFEQVKRVRILVTDPKILKINNIEMFDLNKWTGLKCNDKNFLKDSSNIEIKVCGLYSAEHYAIINDKYLIYGSYNPALDSEGEGSSYNSFAYLDKNMSDNKLINEKRKQFEENFKISSEWTDSPQKTISNKSENEKNPYNNKTQKSKDSFFKTLFGQWNKSQTVTE